MRPRGPVDHGRLASERRCAIGMARPVKVLVALGSRNVHWTFRNIIQFENAKGNSDGISGGSPRSAG